MKNKHLQSTLDKINKQNDAIKEIKTKGKNPEQVLNQIRKQE